MARDPAWSANVRFRKESRTSSRIPPSSPVSGISKASHGSCCTTMQVHLHYHIDRSLIWVPIKPASQTSHHIRVHEVWPDSTAPQSLPPGHLSSFPEHDSPSSQPVRISVEQTVEPRAVTCRGVCGSRQAIKSLRQVSRLYAPEGIHIVECRSQDQCLRA